MFSIDGKSEGLEGSNLQLTMKSRLSFLFDSCNEKSSSSAFLALKKSGKERFKHTIDEEEDISVTCPILTFNIRSMSSFIFTNISFTKPHVR